MLINVLEAFKTLLRMDTLFIANSLLLSSKTVSCTLSQLFNYEMINKSTSDDMNPSMTLLVKSFRSSFCLTFTFMFFKTCFLLLGIFFGYSFILFEPSFLSEHMHLTEHFLFSQNILRVLVLILEDHLVPNYLSFKVSEHTAQTRPL